MQRPLALEAVEPPDDRQAPEDAPVPLPVPDPQDQLAGPRGVDPVRRERVEARDEVSRIGRGRKPAEAADPHPVEPGLVHVPDPGHGEGERLTDEGRKVDEDPVPADSLARRLVRQRVGRAEVEAVDSGDPVGRIAVGRPPAARRGASAGLRGPVRASRPPAAPARRGRTRRQSQHGGRRKEDEDGPSREACRPRHRQETAGSRRVRVPFATSSSARTPTGRVDLSATCPNRSPARIGTPSLPRRSATTDCHVQVPWKLPLSARAAVLELPEDDPGALRETPRQDEVREPAVDPVRILADLLEEEDRPREGRLPRRPDEHREDADVPADEPAAARAGDDPPEPVLAVDEALLRLHRGRRGDDARRAPSRRRPSSARRGSTRRGSTSSSARGTSRGPSSRRSRSGAP